MHQIVTRVFLLNYLVAVLTTIYQFMIVEGEYTYSRMRYLFYKKYQRLYVSDSHFESQAVHKQEHYFSEQVIHPPPLNIVVIMINLASFPLAWKRSLYLKVFKFIGHTIFWIENLLFLSVFLGFELSCSCVIYLKIMMVFTIKIA